VATTDALVFEGVSKTFVADGLTVKALDAVDARTQPGRVTGLIGPDGAGKTTLMRLAAGLLVPDSGSIKVLGIDVGRQPLAVQSSVGYMPQRFGLYEDLSVQENLDLYADLQGVVESERASRFRELMHMTGLTPFIRRLAGRLSGGMKQNWAWPARWCSDRACYCWTSRRWGSTQCHAASCGPSSIGRYRTKA
jgi:ABC-2 type transport system ATP-binding protein